MTLSLSDIQTAHQRVLPFLEPTPLLRCEALENELNYSGRIFLKCEHEQPTGSFKVRGAFNALVQLTEEEKRKGVVTRSSGNFAQAVSYAANEIRIKATIVMPDNAPQIKIEGTEKFGAKILFSGSKHEEGERMVAQIVEEEGLIPLHPYNHYHTMAGQGTAAIEILNELPEVDYFYCPIGGGGLLSGCSTAFKESNSAIQVHGVEPVGAADYHASRQSGKLERWETVDTIADGLRASSVGRLNWPILNKYVDEVTVVTDDEIKGAMKWLYKKMKITSEPSGATSLAGFVKTHHAISGNVVILISGKNVDSNVFEEYTRI